MAVKEGVKLEVEYVVKVIDENGKVVKVVKGKGKTFNQNFARVLGILMFPVGDVTRTVSVTDVGGTARTLGAPREPYSPNNYAPVAGWKFELGVGESDVAFSRTQYNLLDPLAWVDYSTHTLTDDGTKVKVDISGSWYNDTGVDVTAREIGMRVYWVDTGGYMRVIMIARDVIAPTVVGAGKTIAVAYSITIPF